MWITATTGGPAARETCTCMEAPVQSRLSVCSRHRSVPAGHTPQISAWRILREVARERDDPPVLGTTMIRLPDPGFQTGTHDLHEPKQLGVRRPPIAPELIGRVREVFLISSFAKIYGSAERDPDRLRDDEIRTKAAPLCGRPAPGIEVRVVDGGDGRSASVNRGAVAPRRDVMSRLLEQPGESAQAFRGRVFGPGDVGEGRRGILVTYRSLKDMIVTAARRYSAEVRSRTVRASGDSRGGGVRESRTANGASWLMACVV